MAAGVFETEWQKCDEQTPREPVYVHEIKEKRKKKL